MLCEISTNRGNVPNLARADLGSSLLQSGEGFDYPCMVFDLSDCYICPDGPDLVARLDLIQPRQGFDIHDDLRLDQVFLHLTQQVDPPADIAAVLTYQFPGAGGRRCSSVLKGLHDAKPPVLRPWVPG